MQKGRYIPCIAKLLLFTIYDPEAFHPFIPPDHKYINSIKPCVVTELLYQSLTQAKDK